MALRYTTGPSPIASSTLLQAAHVRPLVEVGFMPEALSVASSAVSPYLSRRRYLYRLVVSAEGLCKWSALVTAWVRHLHQRYDVSGWLWEVWNEPDISYWHGTPEEYDKLYDVTAAAIREELPQARVGGPESTGPANEHAAAFLRQFLEHCAHGVNAATGKVGAPLDFISFHPKGSPRFVDGHVRMNVGAQLRSVQRGMQIMASFPELRNTPIILGESDPEGCAACKGEQNGYRNGALYG